VKLAREKAIPISGDTGIKEIEEKVKNNDFKKVSAKGKVVKKEVKEAYKNTNQIHI